jgi:pyoverdine/dityrosine biosynthesis protein Dit1
MTPWHGIAVQTQNGFELMKKFEALELGARIVEEDGRPSFMTVI